MRAFQSDKLKKILEDPEKTEELRKSIVAVTKTGRAGTVGRDSTSGRFTISFERTKKVVSGKKAK
jgi:hypothetical protein